MRTRFAMSNGGRRILMALLALGTLGGYALGVRSFCHARARHEAFERHVAQICVDAAHGRGGNDR
jgi:hypothetical protein